jgi:hypothetical protein
VRLFYLRRRLPPARATRHRPGADWAPAAIDGDVTPPCNDVAMQRDERSIPCSAGERLAQISISCDECSLEATSACDDCVVSFLLGDADDREAVIVDVMEARAIKMLHGAGLIPELRFQRRVG